MAEKTYPMTLEEKEKLEKELGRIEIGASSSGAETVRLPAHMAICQKTVEYVKLVQRTNMLFVEGQI